VISSILLFSSLHKGGLSGYDDAFYAEYGKQMILGGDWWGLRLNGYHVFEFPPMFPWMEALSMKVFGITDFAAKFPAALSGLLTIVLAYLIAKELFDGFWAPALAMAIMSGTQYFIKYAMHSMTDAPFTFFFTLSIYLYLKGLKEPGYFLLSGTAIGAAILTRSVLGLIPLGIIFLHLIVTGKRAQMLSTHFIGAVALSVALPAVWYGSQYGLYGKRFLNEHFSFVVSKIGGREAVVRDDLRQREVFLCRTIDGQDFTVITPVDGASRRGAGGRFSRVALGFVEYPKLLLRHYWPWLPLALIGLVGQVKALVRSRDSVAALLVIWVACVLIPFSFAEAKVLRYIMPIFPAFAILAAAPLSRRAVSVRSARYVKMAYVLALAALLLAALFPKPRQRAEDMQSLAQIIDANSNPARRVILYTNGERRHNYMSQLVWYSNRYCVHLTELNMVRDALKSCPELIAVVDKQAFNRMNGEPGVSVRALGESENFVCIKAAAQSQ
ncbi:MAG TPA: glycosyltransferase family 39 protein, partial [Blastocatellia bacterium]|nr:glycosyltransferase family 39 protein [Blastocatellia bacterium]